MLYYFFNLYFEVEVEKDEGWVDAGYFSTKKSKTKAQISLTRQYGIGHFSTKAKAEKQLQFHKNLEGFCNHPLDCFKIKKYGVRFDARIKDKSLVDLYELTHEYYDGEYDHVLILPPFSTEYEAIEEIEKLKNRKPFCTYPNGFVIDVCRVDRYIGWPEGFCELNEEDEAYTALLSRERLP